MLGTERLEFVDSLLYELEEPAEIASAVSQLRSAEELQHYLLQYNWNDGFGVPLLIAEHPECDLGVAMALFWLADGPRFYTEEGGTKTWKDFCKLLADRILTAHYKARQTSFDPPVGRVELLKLKKAGVPSAFLEEVAGELPAPQ
jgi:hypothetical protein